MSVGWPGDMEETVTPDEVIEPESEFGRVAYLVMDSYRRKKGRTLGTDQVKALGEGVLSMAETIMLAQAYTMALEALLFKFGEEYGVEGEQVYDMMAKIQQGVGLDDIQIPKKKFWTPR